MSWDEEWARLKADALARGGPRPDSGMRLNQLPAEAGGGGAGGGGAGGGDLIADAASIDGSSHLLLEIAGVLYEGRMDGENATQARAPRAHPDVSAHVTTFARFAQDQYNDMVVLLAALSGNVKSAGSTYTKYDQDVRDKLNTVLKDGTYTPPKGGFA
ncbi:hypothetical protein [Streptomyces sp. KL116D]|uniref:hypothetical protein n=1 Tax=Streptomyces sp. KL116D TaxID=3045152 RepID=UPI003558C635